MEKTDMKKGINQFGLRFGIAGALIIAVELLTAAFLTPVLVDKGIEFRVLASFALTIFGVDIVGFPTAYFLCKGLPKGELEHEKWGFWKYILGLIMVAGLCLAGTIIGLPVHLLLTVPFGVSLNESSTIGILMMNSGFLPRVLTVGILAPIFEELIFRKVVVDHLSHYSKYLAIIVSGVSFGLFHGNFQQFFYAMFLGLFFAYVYTKTGNIKYTIGYHMIVNMTSSVVTMYLTGKYLEAYDKVDLVAIQKGIITDADIMNMIPMLIYTGYMFGLFLIGVAGIVLFFVNLKKFKLQPVEGEMPKAEAKKAAFNSIGLWLFYGVCIFLFVRAYLPDMLHPMAKTDVSVQKNEVVTVADGFYAVESTTYPLEVTAASAGTFSVEIASADNTSKFISGVVLRSPDGEVQRAFTAGTMTGTYEETLKQGTYQVEVYYLTSPEKYEEFNQKFLVPLGEGWEGPEADFYQDGSFDMTYEFKLEYKVRK